ncbi:MAG: Molybdenum cofactor synthesis domain-containing protein [Candidatus Tokpelaia hoelldobleri]|uniref:Molybdopterin molybdenumtransferase n=1 Tax=Candidatus Tokpelaia hoelldobleri TaxID=1902579 RepID=A0A1U9JU21_9HYPH|nr:MAG: Molybdenum cofactor synthesis domain-containing protein [Candidatus Tokpelaia hoelldoblerii]
MALLSVEEALKTLLADIKPLAAQTVPLHQAGGRILTSNVAAALTQPPFTASAMDGYALRAQDIQTTPVQLKIVGEAAAGHSFNGRIRQGEAVRIFTGAPVPDDADTVIMQEMTGRFDKHTVTILSPIEENKNIRPAGGDFHQNDIVLHAGQLMTPAALALAAASGHATLEVVTRPKVAILSTGDELVAPGRKPADNQIIASNASGLAEIARLHGAEVIDLGIVADNRQAIRQAIESAIKQQADILLTSGGVSVGDYDLVQDVLKEAGMKLAFWKIAMRPGKPLMFGTLSGRHPVRVLGLPGNPVSCLLTAQLFFVPLAARLAGKQYTPPLAKAHLTQPLAANGARRHYIRACMQKDETGAVAVTPLDNQDSSLLSVLTKANCLIVHEADTPALPEGSACTILMFPA